MLLGGMVYVKVRSYSHREIEIVKGKAIGE
jgi:hypothetical protein